MEIKTVRWKNKFPYTPAPISDVRMWMCVSQTIICFDAVESVNVLQFYWYLFLVISDIGKINKCEFSTIIKQTTVHKMPSIYTRTCQLMSYKSASKFLPFQSALYKKAMYWSKRYILVILGRGHFVEIKLSTVKEEKINLSSPTECESANWYNPTIS